jgi:RNA polymerase sigma factor (sigma-70 family)
MTDQPARVPAQASPSATAAYVRIYEEEQPRLVAYARSLTRNTWAAEDLVAEAHFRVWRRLSAGHEIDNVPAYLMTTVRHLASSVASATHETPRDPQIPEQASASARHVDDPAEQVSSTDLLVRVLGELPERWVQALWLADAEGQPLETVGRQIGAKQGATAVLLHRAREGMRQAFLRSQTEAPDDPACEVHWVRMPAYVRGNATPRQSERLLAHVDSCDGCRGRLAVLIRANNRLPALVGPALLVFVVGGGTGKFLASLTAGSAGVASVTGQGTGQGLLHTARAAGPKAKAALASGTAAAAAIAVVLALGVNDSPATVTSPEKVPVAQGPVVQAPVTGPSAGVAEETPGGAARQVERDRDRDRSRGDGVGAVVTEEVGGTVNSGDSGSVSGSSDGGGAEGDPTAPEQPAPEVPDPGPSPVEPVPGDEEPKPPVAPEPTPTPPKPEQPKPTPPKPEQPKPEQPKPEQPKPEHPKPGTPGEEPPVPEPSAPTPADPDPVGETPEPPTYSEPPTAPESPEPSDPSEPPAPEPPEPPTTGDDCGRQPTPEPTRESSPGTSAPGKGVEPKHV